MTIFDAALQGIIQGATEFLPVSSSGHLSISQHLFGIQLPGILFDIMLHLGTLAAVVFVYRQLVWRLIKEFFSLCGDILHKQFKWGEMSRDRRLLMMLIIGLVPLFLLFLPIPGTGMKIKDFSEMLASDTSILMEGLSLLLTSALLFLGIHANKQNQQKMVKNRDGALVPSKGRRKIHTVDALVIGFTQCMAAVFPGLSRLYPVGRAHAGHQPANRPGLFLCAGHPLHCRRGPGVPKRHRLHRRKHRRGPADCGGSGVGHRGLFGH